MNKLTWFIKFSTSDNAILVLWLVHSNLGYQLIYLSLTIYGKWFALNVAKLNIFTPEIEISLGIKHKKNVFGESLDQFRSLEVREKIRNVFVMVSDHQVLHNIASSSSSSFSISLGFSPFFRSYFVLPNFWSLRNLIKQLFHSRLLDMRVVIANSALRASLAIYHLISNARSWNNC